MTKIDKTNMAPAAQQSMDAPYMARQDVIGNDKGGTGKSETTELLALQNIEEGVEYILGEIDNDGPLRRRLGEEIVKVTVPSGSSLKEDPTALKRRFNPLYGLTEFPRSGYELGAGTPALHLQWEQLSNIADASVDDGVRKRFIGVCSPDASGMLNGVNFVYGESQLYEGNADYAIVLNHLTPDAAFDSYKTMNVWRTIEQMQQDYGLLVLTMPYRGCESTNWAKANDLHNMALLRLLDELMEKVAYNVKAPRLGQAIEPITDRRMASLMTALNIADDSITWREKRTVLTQEWSQLRDWLVFMKQEFAPLRYAADVIGQKSV